MSNGPVAELLRLRPAADPNWATGAQASRILGRSRELAASGPAVVSRSGRTRRVTVSAALGVVVLTGAGIAGVAAFRPSTAATTHPGEVGCYQTLSATPDAITIWNNPDETAASGIAICRSQWVNQFGVAPPAVLVACLVPASGAPAVVPGIDGLSAQDTCARIGAQAEGPDFRAQR
jgi:hypothetical protein